MQTPTIVPVVSIVLFTRVVAKLPCDQAVRKLSKTGDSGGLKGLRPISAFDFSELNTSTTSGPMAKSASNMRTM